MALKKRKEVKELIKKLKKTNNWKDIFDLSYEDAIKYLAEMIPTRNCNKDCAILHTIIHLALLNTCLVFMPNAPYF